MNHGEPVQVTIGGRLQSGTVLYERGESVRVRLADGRERTVPAERVRPVRVAPVPTRAAPDSAPTLVMFERAEHYQGRSVPKPPGRWRSDAYLRYVRSQSAC